MKTSRTKAFFGFAFCMALTVPVWANSTLRLDFGQLSRLASRVVAGRVIKVSVSEDSNGYLYSTITMSVSRATPAQLAGREYTFRMIGGELNGRSQYIADYPTLREGNDVVLFLNAETSGVFGPTVGLGQGVFLLDIDAQDSVQRVMDRFGRPVLGIRDQKLLRGVARAKDAQSAGLGDAAKGRPAMPLDEFFEQIQLSREANPLQGVAGLPGR